MSTIENVTARQIIDSRGNPTIEADIVTSDGIIGRAAVPSGASTGMREALELRDCNPKYYMGKSVETAINTINDKIANSLFDFNVFDQAGVDSLLLKLDGTKNKSKLGANAILAVSLAVARAGANSLNMPLYRYLGGAMANHLPVPMMNVINGGAHASNNLDLQEFMIFPSGADTFSEGLRMGIEIYHTLKKILNEKGLSTAVGDEGGFAPDLESHEEAFQLLMNAIKKAGYKPGEDCELTIDAASSEIYEDGKYSFEGKQITSYDLNAWYEKMIDKYPIVSIEDGMAEQDADGWKLHTKALRDKIQVVGDDLFVTNRGIFKKGIEDKFANSILVKLNQIGSVKETWETIELARKSGYSYVISHRSGETADSFIAHLAVASRSGQIKTGAPARTERVEKYNELLRIEEELGENATYGVI